MPTNSRFAVAVHLLTLSVLANGGGGDRVLTSEAMALQVGTNPVVLRRILGRLREAGVVASRSGPGGGWRLTQPPEAITLLDIYRAVGAGPMLAPRAAVTGCPIGHQMPRVLQRVFANAEAALERELATVTLAEVLADVRAGCRSNAIAAAPDFTSV